MNKKQNITYGTTMIWVTLIFAFYYVLITLFVNQSLESFIFNIEIAVMFGILSSTGILLILQIPNILRMFGYDLMTPTPENIDKKNDE